MNINLKKYKNIYIILLEGELDLYNAPELERIFQTLIDKGVTLFVLDLNDISYIDSSGIGILLKLKSLTAGEQMRFILSSVEGEVLNVLNLTNLIDFFEIESDYQNAAKKLLRPSKASNGVKVND